MWGGVGSDPSPGQEGTIKSGNVLALAGLPSGSDHSLCSMW